MQNTTNTQHHPQTTHATHTIHHTPTTPTSPSPLSLSPLCVLCEACHMHCVVVGTLQHTALLCSILSALLFLSLSSTTITRKNTGCGEKRGRKEWLGKEEEEEERSDAKTSGKRGQKEKKEITTPGVPRLSPTLVLTRPEQASLH